MELRRPKARRVPPPPLPEPEPAPPPPPLKRYGHLIPEGMINWFENAEALLPLVEDRKPKIAIEVGSWLGSSAIQIARLLQTWGGTLICVDHWHGDTSWWAQEGMPLQIQTSFETFRFNLARHGVGNVIVHRGRSQDVARVMPKRSAGLIYIDASHDEMNVRADIAAWWPIVKPGGILAGDDYGSTRWTGCTVAWDTCGLPVHTERGPGVKGLVWVEKPRRRWRWLW